MSGLVPSLTNLAIREQRAVSLHVSSQLVPISMEQASKRARDNSTHVVMYPDSQEEAEAAPAAALSAGGPVLMSPEEGGGTNDETEEEADEAAFNEIEEERDGDTLLPGFRISKRMTEPPSVPAAPPASLPAAPLAVPAAPPAPLHAAPLAVPAALPPPSSALDIVFENPTSGGDGKTLFTLPEFKSAINGGFLIDNKTSYCMYGTPYRKHTTFASTFQGIRLMPQCSNTEGHTSCGRQQHQEIPTDLAARNSVPEAIVHTFLDKWRAKHKDHKPVFQFIDAFAGWGSVEHAVRRYNEIHESAKIKIYTNDLHAGVNGRRFTNSKLDMRAEGSLQSIISAATARQRFELFLPAEEVKNIVFLVWLSTPCETYSLQSRSTHRPQDQPLSEEAQRADNGNRILLRDARFLAQQENLDEILNHLSDGPVTGEAGTAAALEESRYQAALRYSAEARAALEQSRVEPQSAASTSASATRRPAVADGETRSMSSNLNFSYEESSSESSSEMSSPLPLCGDGQEVSKTPEEAPHCGDGQEGQPLSSEGNNTSSQSSML